MKNINNILLVPGTLQYVKHYKEFDGVDIWICNKKEKINLKAKYFIGHSLGVNYILNANVNDESKFIFVNPLIKKRSAFNLFVRWIKFLVFEGFRGEKLVPVRYWLHVLRQVFLLLRVDVIGKLQEIPKENIFVIRGKQDNFFCDCEDVDILIKNNFKVIEVDAGHDWNSNIARAVKDVIKL